MQRKITLILAVEALAEQADPGQIAEPPAGEVRALQELTALAQQLLAQEGERKP